MSPSNEMSGSQAGGSRTEDSIDRREVARGQKLSGGSTCLPSRSSQCRPTQRPITDGWWAPETSGVVLEARGRPFGRARVELQLAPTSSGTAVSIDEVITSPRLLRLLNPVLGPLVRLRNRRTLARLSRTVAERRSN